MKKIVFLFVLLFASIHCFAQNADLKHYYDFSQGYDGWATAMFLDDYIKQDITGQENDYFELINNKIAEKLTPITKLTKNNNWLFRKALNEWDYGKGEMYAVICSDSPFAKTGVMIVILVKENNDLIWHAYSINEGDFDKTFNK